MDKVVMPVPSREEVRRGILYMVLSVAVFSVVNAFVNAIVVGRASDRFGNRLMSTIGIGALVVCFSCVPFIRNVRCRAAGG